MEDSTVVFEGSKGTLSADLCEIFQPPPLQISVKNAVWADYPPIQKVDNKQSVVFVVNSGENFLDLSQTYLYCRMRLQYLDGTKLKDDDEASTINCPIFSQFSAHKIFCGGEEIASIENFNYNQYLLQLLNNSRDAKETSLTMGGFFEEREPRKHDTKQSTVYTQLKKMFRNSREKEFLGRLSGGLYDCTRPFAPGQTLRFEFVPATDEFFILDYGANPETRKITRELIDIRLITKQLTLQPSLALAITNESRLKPYIYPHSRLVQRSLYINGGATSCPYNTISFGTLPTRVVVAFVNRLAYSGVLESNPYSFTNQNVKSCYLRAGSNLFPSDRLKRKDYDFGNKMYTLAFKSLLDTMNLTRETGLGQLTYESFGNNCTLFAFDLSPNLSAGEQQVWKSSNLQLYADFATPIPENGSQALIWLEVQSILTLDSVNQTTNIEPPGI